MFSKFSKSGVFTSPVDYFCLVCECRLRDERDANAHVAKPVHIKNLDSTNYFEKNEEDCVRKIKKCYFCELCNHLLSTAARVRLHIMEPKHIENKSTQFLQRKGNFIVAFSNVLIDDKAWNGIIDDTCVICNTEFDDENIHKNETIHIINLIQSKARFDRTKNIFRKIDDSSFQCLTCNMVVALSEIESHFNQTEHKNLYQKNSNSTTIAAPEEKEISNNKYDKKEMQNVASVLTDKPENEIASNTSKIDDTCCLGNISQNVKSESDKERQNQQRATNENNIQGNNSKENINIINKVNIIKEHTPIDDTKICEILNANNYIITDPDGKPWCILCSWILDAFSVEAHINSLHHQIILKLHMEHMKKLNSNKDSSNILRSNRSVADNHIADKNVDTRGNVLDYIEQFQKNNININLEFQTAVCKKCSKGLDYNVQSIKDHIEEHTKESEQKVASKTMQLTSGLEAENIDGSCKKNSLYTTPVLIKSSNEEVQKKDNESFTDTEKELDTFVKKNYMKYTDDKSKVHCNKCNTNIPPSLINLKEHVAGLAHKSKTNNQAIAVSKPEPKQSDKENLLKIPVNSFVSSFTVIDSLRRDLVLNEKIFISIFSWLMIVDHGNRFRCLLCETNFHDVKSHLELVNFNHKKVLNEIPVIIYEESSEFIREIRPGYFHCGYCNVAQTSWDSMENHLQTTTHKESKNGAQWRLNLYMPQIVSNRFKRERQEQFMAQMIFNAMFDNNRRSDSDCD